MVRLGLVSGLAREVGLEVVGEARTGRDALDLFQKLKPDITLMDGLLPDIHGVEVTRRIIADHPAARIILISINDTSEDIHSALEAGAFAYLSKSCDLACMIHAIRTVAAGGRYLPKELEQKLAERRLQSALSVREMEVLRLVAHGNANKAIAHTLSIGEVTVKTHLTHILAKLGAADRTHAVRIARDRGLVR